MNISPIKFNDFKQEVKVRGREYRRAINQVLDSGWFILGQEVEGFETEFAEYIGIKHCIGVANGQQALEISLLSLGIGQGDEVITSPISAMATTLAIISTGATPIFADINNNGLIEIDSIKDQISNKTKAILPVHLYGQANYPDSLSDFCQSHQLFLIEDACQAHGSTFKNKKLGTFGNFGCFSFYPTKNLGAFGDGGAIVTDSDHLAQICREMRDYGQSQKYLHTRIGLNSRLDEIQAAILRRKLNYLDSDNGQRGEIAKEYISRLSVIPSLKFVHSSVEKSGNFHLFVIRTSQRDELQAFLKTNYQISTLIHYPLAIPDQPLFNNQYASLAIPQSRQFVKEILSLPISPFMNKTQVKFICRKIVEFFSKY
jgi:dTDP-4-amino-4,6-dideoxygalactose transaminase